MRIIKLKFFPVPVRLHFGSSKFKFRRYFTKCLRYLRTLCIVWSLVRRRVTRRLTRLQTMRKVFKYSKIVQNGSMRLRFGCGYFFQFTNVQYAKYDSFFVMLYLHAKLPRLLQRTL